MMFGAITGSIAAMVAVSMNEDDNDEDDKDEGGEE